MGLVDLNDHPTLDTEDFDVFMKSPINFSFTVHEMLPCFQTFDTQKRGKIYWTQFVHYLDKFSSFFGKNPEKFLQWFGHEYLSSNGWLDYASYWYNNFGYEIEHEGDLLQPGQFEYQGPSKEEQDEFDRIRRAKEEEAGRIRLASSQAEEDQKSKLKEKEESRRRKQQEDILDRKSKAREEDAERLRKANEAEAARQAEEEERMRKQQQADDLKRRKEDERLRK
jgi:hypothetical protein